MFENQKKLRNAWREARVQNYALTRSPETLARMLVELEESYDVVPEFEINEDWPDAVASLKPDVK